LVRLVAKKSPLANRAEPRYNGLTSLSANNTRYIHYPRGAIGMKWVTRARPKIDRVACPWLIKRFVDPEAEFLYVPVEQVMAVAERDGAIPYDVANVELGHHGPECTFDAIIRKYDLAS